MASKTLPRAARAATLATFAMLATRLPAQAGTTVLFDKQSYRVEQQDTPPQACVLEHVLPGKNPQMFMLSITGGAMPAIAFNGQASGEVWVAADTKGFVGQATPTKRNPENPFGDISYIAVDPTQTGFDEFIHTLPFAVMVSVTSPHTTWAIPFAGSFEAFTAWRSCLAPQLTH
jgi:hypothetical protein